MKNARMTQGMVVMALVMLLVFGACGRAVWPRLFRATSVTQPDAGLETVSAVCSQRGNDDCVTRTVSAESSDDYILMLSLLSNVTPGALVTYDSLQAGAPRAVPLPRSPVTLTIDLVGIEQPSVVVTDPTIERLQRGVAELLRRATEFLSRGSNYDLARFRLQFNFVEADSSAQALNALRINSTYNGPLVHAQLGFAADSSSVTRLASVVGQLSQSLFTITASTDQWHTDAELISAWATRGEVEKIVSEFGLSDQNPPVLINAVTWGRFGLMRVTSERTRDSRTLAAELQVSVGSAALSGAAAGSDAKATTTDTVRAVFNGGTANDARELVAAFTARDFTRAFGTPHLQSVAPIGFSSVAAFAPWRTVAVRSFEKFRVTECSPASLSRETKSTTITVHEGTSLADTGIDVLPGDELRIAASGLVWSGFVFLGCNPPTGLGGVAGGNAPMPQNGHSGLIGRIGVGPWLWVGDGSQFNPRDQVGFGGRLLLRTNDDWPGNGNDCSQGFRVDIERSRLVRLACATENH